MKIEKEVASSRLQYSVGSWQIAIGKAGYEDFFKGFKVEPAPKSPYLPPSHKVTKFH
jgi:hypothetical protein